MKIKKMVIEYKLPQPIKIGKITIVAMILETEFPFWPLPKPHYTFSKKGGGKA